MDLAVGRSWERVRSQPATIPGLFLNVVGSVTDIDLNFADKILGQIPDQRVHAEIEQVLGNRRTLVTIVDGGGLEYEIMADISGQKISVLDIAALTIRSKHLIRDKCYWAAIGAITLFSLRPDA